MSNVLTVGMAEWKIAGKPDRLRSSGLGSCVAVVLYDVVNGNAAMAHVMLPDHQLAKSSAFQLAKFADTAVPGLLELLVKSGVNPKDIKAKFVGGAEMFPTIKSRMPSIGARNVKVIKEALIQLKIPIISEDTGGNAGRTIEFDTETTDLHIKTVKHGECVI